MHRIKAEGSGSTISCQTELKDGQLSVSSIGGDGWQGLSFRLSSPDFGHAEWGFKGVKLDFFSWSFDHTDARFRNGGTNVMWKRKFVGAIRALLGEDGFFMHSISWPLGNPLLADYGFNAFRVGMDIHDGSWEKHRGSATWSIPPRGHLLLDVKKGD